MHPGRFRMSEQEMHDTIRHKRSNLTEQDRVVAKLQVDRIVPFAGDFCWLDDRLYHCNWASRGTPFILENWLKSHHEEQNIEFFAMYPSDVWRPSSGLERNHPPVDWENYLDDIAILKKRFLKA